MRPEEKDRYFAEVGRRAARVVLIVKPHRGDEDFGDAGG